MLIDLPKVWTTGLAAIALGAVLSILLPNADAAAWTGSSRMEAVAENFTSVEKIQSPQPGNRYLPGFAWQCRGGYCSCEQVR
jgi:hypothetical protein